MGTLERIQRLEKVEQDRLEEEERRERARVDQQVAADEARVEPSGRLERYERFARLPMAVVGVGWAVAAVVVVTATGSAPEWLVGLLFGLWAIIFVEYVARLLAAPDRRGYVATRRIEPALVVLPVLQPLRLADLPRVDVVAAELALRTRAILRHRGLFRVLLAAAGLLFVGSWLVMLSERDAPGANIHDYGSALWWGIVTMTTVGYGDKFPVTGLGRAVAVVLMLVGIGLLGVITATVASFFVQEHTDANKAKIEQSHQDLTAQLDALGARLDRIEILLQPPAARAAPDQGTNHL
jgi:voltage-gated potassium channel